MVTTQPRPERPRSLFWPIVLVGGGALWLLQTTGVIGGVSLALLLRFWPVVLIVIGMELLVGRRLPWASALIALGAVAVVGLLMVFAPAWGLAPNLELRSERFSAPLGAATAANVNLHTPVGRTQVRALSDSASLLEGDLTHLGAIDFSNTGGSHPTITLRQREAGWTSWTDWASIGDTTRRLLWDIGLSPAVPLDLSVNGGVGEMELDLRGLQLSALRVQGGVGEIDVQLGQAPVVAQIEGGVGAMRIAVPAGTAARIDATRGLGSISVAAPFVRVSSGEGREVWATPGFDQASERITITYRGGVGAMDVRTYAGR
jgi:hypothetical protein